MPIRVIRTSSEHNTIYTQESIYFLNINNDYIMLVKYINRQQYILKISLNNIIF